MALCPCAKPFPNGTERDSGDDRYYCGPRRIGNSILLCGKKEGQFPQHFMVGPNWPCMLSTYGMIIGVTALVAVTVTGSNHWIATVAMCVSCCIVLVAFSATACSDPGIVYRSVDRFPSSGTGDVSNNHGRGGAAVAGHMEAGDTLCGRCDVKRPAGAIHCQECNACVRKFDHHCPWTGKCIGENNIKFFYAFLLCLLIHVGFVGVLVIVAPVVQAL